MKTKILGPAENVVFIHIPKAGGSTVRNYIKQFFKSYEIFPEIRLHHFPNFSNLKIDRERVFLGHLGGNFVRNANAVSVTILRHPVERLLSLYSYFLYPGQGMPLIDIKRIGHLGIEEFFNSERPEIRMNVENAQAWQLGYGYSPKERNEFLRNHDMESQIISAAKEMLTECAVVGTVDQMQLFCNQFGALMGVEHSHDLPETKKLNKSTRRIEWSDLTVRQKKIIESKCQLEWCVFEFAKYLSTSHN